MLHHFLLWAREALAFPMAQRIIPTPYLRSSAKIAKKSLEPFDKGGVTGYFFQKDGMSYICFERDGCFFSVYGSIDTDELVKIAASITKK